MGMTIREKVKWLDTYAPKERAAQMQASVILGEAAKRILERYKRDTSSFSIFSEPTSQDRQALYHLEHAQRYLRENLLALVEERKKDNGK